MNKYIQLFHVSFSQYFIYRLNFVLWRFRNVLNLVLIYFLWNAIFSGKQQIFQYSKEEMLTYVLLINFLSDVVFSSKIHELSGEIINGNIINLLVKPMSIMKSLLSKEIADKLVNISFAIVEISILIFLLKPHIIFQTDVLSLLMFVVTLMIGIMMSFFLSLSVSLVAFWTAEVWAPRFIFIMLVFAVAGHNFPLDILPSGMYNALLFTPFPYFIFLPAKIYLHGFSPDLLGPIAISLVWTVIVYSFSKLLWNKGMREFSFFGK